MSLPDSKPRIRLSVSARSMSSAVFFHSSSALFAASALAFSASKTASRAAPPSLALARSRYAAACAFSAL